MIPQRFAPAQSNAVRKSRIGDGKMSMLPKLKRPGSTDRLSTEARRPSAAGRRSSSAEPSRSTFGGGRLSREASATKIPLNRRSRSQQGDRFGQSSMTPMRSSQYSARPTTTPQRTPSEDRKSRNWQTSLDRALAFVTIKDARPISNVAWQRAELSRVQGALAERGGGSALALVRPLTIARFVDIAGALLEAINTDLKLNNDNYVAKLPHLSKRLLYPGTVSKSWLKTVNTLHAFPHALALIAYLLDLVNHIVMPVLNSELYNEKDEIACIRRSYLEQCWIRFQEPGHQLEDLNAEYLQQLQALLGNDEERVAELQGLIKKYETCLEDETEQAARLEESRLVERREALLAGLRDVRAARRDVRGRTQAELTRRTDLVEESGALDLEIEKANAESQQLKLEVEQQSMSVSERTRLLDDVDYLLRVQDSKQALADQLAKMVLNKETELALWQKKTLDSCLEYNNGLIHLSAQMPHLASLPIDEKELMSAECLQCVASGVETLRGTAGELVARRAAHARERTALARRRAALLEETRTKLSELQSNVHRVQQLLAQEESREAADAVASGRALTDARERTLALRAQRQDRGPELLSWEAKNKAWQSKLASMREYIESKRSEAARLLITATERRAQLVSEVASTLTEKLKSDN